MYDVVSVATCQNKNDGIKMAKLCVSNLILAKDKKSNAGLNTWL